MLRSVALLTAIASANPCREPRISPLSLCSSEKMQRPVQKRY